MSDGVGPTYRTCEQKEAEFTFVVDYEWGRNGKHDQAFEVLQTYHRSTLQARYEAGEGPEDKRSVSHSSKGLCTEHERRNGLVHVRSRAKERKYRIYY